eukprot:6189792-Pleurochrysis_carterae.AAC.3
MMFRYVPRCPSCDVDAISVAVDALPTYRLNANGEKRSTTMSHACESRVCAARSQRVSSSEKLYGQRERHSSRDLPLPLWAGARAVGAGREESLVHSLDIGRALPNCCQSGRPGRLNGIWQPNERMGADTSKHEKGSASGLHPANRAGV